MGQLRKKFKDLKRRKKNMLDQRMLLSLGKNYLIWVILLSSIFIFIPNGYTQQLTKNVPTDSVCISPEVSYKLVEELEKSRITENITIQLEKQTEELNKQIELYKTQVKLLNDTNKAYETYIANQEKIFKQSMNNIEQLNKEKENALKKDLENASKPRWSSLFGAFGLGAGTAALLILLL
jgi:hypothetical protein